LKEEGKDLFDARSASLGHTLQGGVPSPLDRTRAARLSLRCMQFLEEHAVPNAQSVRGKRKYDKSTAVMIAIRGSRIVYATVDEVAAHTDFKLRRGKDEWWAEIKDLTEMMGGRTGLVRA
jgi:6-phosphofructokinase 1